METKLSSERMPQTGMKVRRHSKEGFKRILPPVTEGSSSSGSRGASWRELMTMLSLPILKRSNEKMREAQGWDYSFKTVRLAIGGYPSKMSLATASSWPVRLHCCSIPHVADPQMMGTVRDLTSLLSLCSS